MSQWLPPPIHADARMHLCALAPMHVCPHVRMRRYAHAPMLSPSCPYPALACLLLAPSSCPALQAMDPLLITAFVSADMDTEYKGKDVNSPPLVALTDGGGITTYVLVDGQQAKDVRHALGACGGLNHVAVRALPADVHAKRSLHATGQISKPVQATGIAFSTIMEASTLHVCLSPSPLLFLLSTFDAC